MRDSRWVAWNNFIDIWGTTAAFIFKLLRSWRVQSPEISADSYQIRRRNIWEHSNFTIATGKLQIRTTAVGTVSKLIIQQFIALNHNTHEGE
jgi:hypothetical protein